MTTLLKFNPPVIGHRGACAYAPENTMASFIKAAQLGIKWVEFDVMQSADGMPIIFHDELLDRTTNGHGNVSEYSYSYLQSLDAGKWFNYLYSSECIPSLMTVIEFLQEAKIAANIEIKALPKHEERLVKCVMEKMKPFLSMANENFLFSSFSMDALHLLRKYSPECQIGLLLHEWEPDWHSVCNDLNCVSVHVNEKIMTENAAHKIKAMGKMLLCYTVNDPIRANQLFSWGVDAVFSDAPDRIVNQLPAIQTAR